MPGPVLHTGATATCPHFAPLTIIAASPRVTVSGMNAAVLTDQGLVAACPLATATPPTPCVTTKWIVGATRVTAGGQPLLINPCVALCMTPQQTPNGPPVISGSQTRVVAT